MVVQAQLVEVMVVSKVDRLEVRQEQLVGMMVHLMNVVVVVKVSGMAFWEEMVLVKCVMVEVESVI